MIVLPGRLGGKLRVLGGRVEANLHVSRPQIRILSVRMVVEEGPLIRSLHPTSPDLARKSYAFGGVYR